MLVYLNRPFIFIDIQINLVKSYLISPKLYYILVHTVSVLFEPKLNVKLQFTGLNNQGHQGNNAVELAGTSQGKAHLFFLEMSLNTMKTLHNLHTIFTMLN